MPTYRQADADVPPLIAELILDNHPELEEAGVRVGVLFAFAPTDENTGEPTAPALKKYGLPTEATVRVVSQRDRIAGLPDAQILIDGEAWKEWTEGERRARLDRELMYLEVSRDEDGAVKLDDCCRPRLKLRPPDWLVSGFAAIARRHGEASLEVAEARKLADRYGNLLFDFAAEVT